MRIKSFLEIKRILVCVANSSGTESADLLFDTGWVNNTEKGVTIIDWLLGTHQDGVVYTRKTKDINHNLLLTDCVHSTISLKKPDDSVGWPSRLTVSAKEQDAKPNKISDDSNCDQFDVPDQSKAAPSHPIPLRKNDYSTSLSSCYW